MVESLLSADLLQRSHAAEDSLREMREHRHEVQGLITPGNETHRMARLVAGEPDDVRDTE